MAGLLSNANKYANLDFATNIKTPRATSRVRQPSYLFISGLLGCKAAPKQRLLSMSEDFTFPVLNDATSTSRSTEKVPLTARSTVTSFTGANANPVTKPIQAVASSRSNLEHRNKGDPLMTRLIYGLIAWLTNVPLEKGYSQVDWMKLSRATPAPALRRNITKQEVQQHKSRDDAWMIFRNRVYNITPYLKFHPGGSDILLKAAGKDGTSLFMKYHPWVNIDVLMEKCLIGLLAEDSHQPQAAEPAGVQPSASSSTSI